MELFEIVKKISGPTEPVGETNYDNKAYENLEVIGKLVIELTQELFDISQLSNRCEYSLCRAGKKAQFYLNEIKERTGK